MIGHGNVLDKNIFATGKKDDAGRRGGINAAVGHPGFLSLRYLFDKCLAVTVNFSFACDGDVFAFLGIDQGGASVARAVVGNYVLFRNFGIIFAVWGAVKHAVRLNVKVDVLLENDGSRHVNAARYDNASAARFGAGIDSGLNGGSVQCFSVGNRAEIFYIKVHLYLRFE